MNGGIGLDGKRRHCLLISLSKVGRKNILPLFFSMLKHGCRSKVASTTKAEIKIMSDLEETIQFY